MRHLTTLLFILLLAWPTALLAQDQATLNRNAEESYKKADAELNRVYQALSAKLDAASRKKLVTSEQAWIKFRDADAAAKAQEWDGGSIQPMIRFGWLARLTRARTTQLQQWLGEFKER